MDRRVWNIGWKKLTSLGRDDNGAVLVLTLALFFFLFLLVSGVYVVGEAVHRRIELQNACDAAAYSAAVVQADGLSRIATVNRAMSWTYAQMVKRQTDYITYRWLKLTYKQFKEDRDNAKDWHWYLLPCDENHDQDGVGWWCGIGPKDGMDQIRLNQRFNIKVDNLKNILDQFSSLFDGDGEQSTDDFAGSSSNSWSNIQPALLDSAYGGGGFNGANDLMTVNSDNPVKNEVYQEIQKRGEAGETVGPAEIEQIYKDIFTRTNPEPDPNETNSLGQNIGRAKWEKWHNDLKKFTDKNKLRESDYVCKVCGKPIQGGNHSQCINQMMNAAENSQGGSGGGNSSAAANAPTSKYNWGGKLAKQIKNDKKTIEMMNLALDAIALNMTLGMQEAAKSILEYNLPRDKDGELSDDFYYTVHIPTGSNPYGAMENKDSSLAGIFSPVYNTEEYETLFLNMADGAAEQNLLKYFKSSEMGERALSNLTGEEKAGGIDQWFIRTYPAETFKNNERNIMPTAESYYAEGISRSYKNANRKEGSGMLGHSRANHILSIGDNYRIGGGSDLFGIASIFNSFLESILQEVDLAPSCINRRDRFPEMCARVSESTALVSQYRWCSAKWFCFFTIYTFGIEWHHPFFPKFYCPDHGYGMMWIGDQFEALSKGMTRNDYRNCFMGADDKFILKGHARIYGDDRDLVDEQYVGVPARPWLLNEKYFSGDGTITVGLARRQRNPWQRFLSWFYEFDAKSPNVSSGLMSLFNVKDSNYIWTASTARAAYRRRADKINGAGDDGVASWHTSHPTGYDMKFDVSAWPEALQVSPGHGASKDLKKLRVGCVCGKNNEKRLEVAWNLGTYYWDATLLPVRYAKGYIGKYESLKGSSANWTSTGGDGQGVFEMLGGLHWNGVGKNSSSTVSGQSILSIENQDGKELGDLQELQKLKIY